MTKLQQVVLIGALIGLASASCQKTPELKMIGGVPHQMGYEDCTACDKIGYFDRTCSRCNGTGIWKVPCIRCLTTGTVTADTPSGGTREKKGEFCKGVGNFKTSCKLVEKAKCRPCKGTGRRETGYEPIESGVDW